MITFNIKKTLEKFSDKPITYESKSKKLNYTTYMLSKAGSYFFVKVFDSDDNRLPFITVQSYISDLPSEIERNEEFLAKTCNQINYLMDNATTTTYIKDHKKGIFFLGVKLGIPFISDVFKTSTESEKSEHMLQMFLYTAFIEVTKTREKLSKLILEKGAKNENA